MYLYALKNLGMPNLYKIGFSDNPPARAARLSAVSGVPHPFEILTMASCYSRETAIAAEAIAHIMLAPYRVNSAREFFGMERPAHAAHVVKVAAFVAGRHYTFPSEWDDLLLELTDWPLS